MPNNPKHRVGTPVTLKQLRARIEELVRFKAGAWRANVASTLRLIGSRYNADACRRVARETGTVELVPEAFQGRGRRTK